MNTTATTAAAPSHTMPYPGLRPFEEADQSLFFGREEQIGGLLRQLEDAAFVAVVGSSGSGKSSLVRAGLLPAMREGFLFGTTDWRIAVIKPGHEPYQRLARESGRMCVRRLKSRSCSRRSAVRIVGCSRQWTPPASAPRPTCWSWSTSSRNCSLFAGPARVRTNVASRDEAAAFVAMLLRTAADPDSRVRIVLTMRSDFIGDCEAFLGLPEAISRSQFLVPRLTRSQMEEAIVRPGQIRDAEFQPFTFEEGLVNRIINDAGDRPDQLPLMQHALMRTWKFSDKRLLTYNDYGLLAGGIEGALSKHADAAWEEIKRRPAAADRPADVSAAVRRIARRPDHPPPPARSAKSWR